MPVPEQSAYPVELHAAIATLDADQWAPAIIGGEPVGAWVRRHVRTITLASFEGGYAGVNDLHRPEVVFNTRYLDELPDTLKAALLVHEARHLELRRGHTCPNGWADATMEEGGAIAAHVLYLEHVGERAAADWYRRFAIGCV